MKEQVIVSDKTHGFGDIEKVMSNGDIPICSKCKTPLICTINKEDAEKYNRNIGVYCPENYGHIQISVHTVIMDFDEIIKQAAKDDPDKS